MNTKRALKIMDKHKLDGIIASHPVNLKYLCNYDSYVLKHIAGNDAYAILPNKPGAKPTLIVPLFDMELAVDLLPYVAEIVPYGRFIYYLNPGEKLSERDEWIKKSALDGTPIPTVLGAVASTLKKLGLDGKRIGLDESYFKPKSYKNFVENMPLVDFVDAYAILREIRMVKTPEEIELLEQGVRAQEEALQNSLNLAAEGVSEKDFEDVFLRTIFEHGGISIFDCIYFGEQSNYNQVACSPDKRLAAGTLIRYDVGSSFKGYFSDIARTAVFGKPTEIQKQRYQAMLEGHLAALELVKPGARASDLFNRAIEVSRKRIPEFNRTHIGHGIGVELYEPPNLTPTSEVVIEEGMVFNVELPYYELGRGGFQIEDTLVVNKNGFRLLTTLDQGLLKA